MTSNIVRRNWLIDITFLTFVLLIFYTFYLGSYPLFVPDEGRYSEVAREMIVSGDYITPRVNGVAFLDKPVLYYWLQAAAIKLFGLNEWALRFFPALLGIFGCLITYICTRRLFGRRTGLLATIILATTPLYFSCAHYANLDLEVAAWISASLLCLINAIHAREKINQRFLFASYTFAALAFLTKGMIGIAFPVIITGTWMLLLRRWDLFKSARLISGFLLILAIVAPWYVLVQHANPAFLHYFFVTQQITRFLSAADFNNPSPVWFYVPIILIGFIPWTCLLVQSFAKYIHNCWHHCQQYAAELFFMLWFVFVLVFFSIPSSKTISYILPAFPPLAILTGRYLSSLWDEFNTMAIRRAVILFAITNSIAAVLLFSLFHYQWMDLPATLSSHFTAMAAVLLVSAICSILFIKKSVPVFFSMCTATALLFLFIFTTSAIDLNTNTVRPMALYLKTLLKSDDEVVHYFKYYQDVPIYLQQQVTVVADWQSPDIIHNDNWVREFWFGMPFQKTDTWLITEQTFWGKWHDKKRLYVFLNANYFKRFKKHAKNYYLLGKYNDIILVTNKKT